MEGDDGTLERERLGREPRAAAPQPRADQEIPEAISKRRYARGEVDREEYERGLKDPRM